MKTTCTIGRAPPPTAIVTRLRDAAIKALERPDVQQVRAKQGLEVETSTPRALAARIGSERKTWAEFIESAGIKAE